MTATANELLLPALLAMDVYHRNVVGALSAQLQGKTTTLDNAIATGNFNSIEPIDLRPHL